ncbi:MAG TPA: tetratricopeptide repeat protein, partial [Nannocystaceae bacterium]|nr:tetratricopeptide repeat protein [Nannocystaceae bacterium]
IASAGGHYDEAVAAYRHAEQQLLGVLGPGEPSLRTYHNNLGVALLLQGKLEPALAKFEQALAAGEASIGTEHPDIADYLMNIGNVRLEQRDGERAKQMFARAMTILARDATQNRRRIALLRQNMAYADALSGERATAKREAELALAELRLTLGPRHPHVAGALDLLGFVALQEGDLDRADRHFAEAEAIVVAGLGEAHPLTSAVRMRKGELLLERGDVGAAARILGPVVDRLAESPGADHPDHATARALLAEARLIDDASGAASELVASLARLRTLDHHYVGRAEFALARALWESPTARTAAKEHARSSIAALEGARDPIADRVRAWQAAHS